MWRLSSFERRCLPSIANDSRLIANSSNETSPPLGGLVRLMEARGIEPRSETRSTTASTCVAHQLRSPGAGRQATHSWTSSLFFRPAAESAPRGYPEFAIPMKPPRASFPMGRCSNAMRYAARAKLLLAVVIFPECFTRDPSTWARGHSFTNPVEASRPRKA